ncbi:MAG: nitronate monooxygenase [Bacteroidetes bacterium]|nr:MAG: nitronate monooxygenase [Bacteroidota bacterium]
MFSANRLTQLLGIKFPVIQGGMVWCSGWRLAAAVSEAGGLGVIGVGSMTPALLSEHIKKYKAACDKPFGVNIPMLYSQVEECVAVCEAEGVPVLITSAGSPKKFTARAHAAGMKVGHVVPSPKLAQKVEAAGCDFVVCEGMEAGGHNGLEEISTLVLLQMVAADVKIPIVSAGGYMDGRGLAAALALGAEGVQIGSRFAVTVESSAAEAYKEHMLEVRERGTMLTSRSWGPTRLVPNQFSDALTALERSGASPAVQREFIGRGRSRMGIFDGDLVRGELEVGQIAGAFRDIPTVAEVMDRLVQTFGEAVERLNGMAK